MGLTSGATELHILVVMPAGPSGGPVVDHLRRRGLHVVEPLAATGDRVELDGRGPIDLALIDSAVDGGWEGAVALLTGVVPPGRIAVLAPYWGTVQRAAAVKLGLGLMLLKRVHGGELARRLEELAALANGRAELSGGRTAHREQAGRH